ncbi:MAG: carboxypeptidase-like regulatory domain-containing protein [Chitinophagales bacterium]|nr:carboxypeptidase-like regulatory domain-containing protein [Chitinophagales bacterium]
MLKTFFSSLLLIFLLYSYVQAQTGSIAGHLADAATSEDIIGANIYIENDPSKGASSDFDGRYLVGNLPAGTYNVVISYISYQTKVVENVTVTTGEVSVLDITLSGSARELEEVVVRTERAQENINSLLVMQKNSSTISDGISSDIIRKTPDKNTAEALKRVSGVSLAENRFAVIRGLSDRYNSAMINGTPLPSTEADRKNFTFDLIPSNLVDNIIILKTAQPDLPGDFAGGIIQVNTRDIPDADFLNLSISGGFNSTATFNPHYTYPGGTMDWLGIDDGTRAIPTNFPATEILQNSDQEQTIEATRLLANDWGFEKMNSTIPNMAMQISGGLNKKLFSNDFGGVFSLTYNNSNRYNEITRQDFNFSDTTALYRYIDSTYTNNVLAGALLNLGYKISENNKIVFKNSFTINSTDATIIRGGNNFEQATLVRNYAYDFVANTLFNSQLSGDHFIKKAGLKIHWEGGFAQLTRSQPDFRKLFYNRNPEDSTFLAYVPFGSASPSLAGKFFSNLDENVYSGALDLIFPFNIFKNKSNIKAGLFYQGRDRAFEARVLGYTVTNPTAFYSQNEDPNAILALPPGQLFNEENIGTAGFSIDEITNPSDVYTGSSQLTATYLMLDNKLPLNFRLVWGARLEFFNQQLTSFDYTNNPVDVNTKSSDFSKLPFDFLPSANLIYGMDDKTNIRLSFSKTVARPEFRELAPFSFYDFSTTSVVIGNDSLQRTNIYNYDFRIERFFASGQVISGSVFYKKFNEPIEQTIDFISSGGYIRSYSNVTSATNFGLELELRKNFDLLEKVTGWKQFSNFIFSANLAYINSKVDVSSIANAADSTRSLQGQSPYIINLGLTYTEPVSEFGVSIFFNEIGRRIIAVGSSEYLDIYEAPRPILDVQLSKRLFENASLRLNFQDIFAQKGIFYQDQDDDNKFIEANDKTIIAVTTGRVITLGFNYRF